MSSIPSISLALCGSAAGEQLPEVCDAMKRLGEETAKRGIVLLTGACTGYPYYAAQSHFKSNGLSIGISPAESFIDHRDTYKYPQDVYQSIIYTGNGIKGRNVILIRAADAVVCVGGGVGTMNEFTIAYDDGKPIGILTGTGGISADFAPLAKKFYKKPRHSGIVIEESDPVKLLDTLFQTITR